MSAFRTVLTKNEWDFQIDYPSKHLMLGSCFSQNIGNKLKQARFDCLINPFGILYHPLVISRVMSRMLANKKYEESDLLFKNDHYVSFDHHGKFNNRSKKIILDNINSEFKSGRAQLLNADYIYITWGSSYAYRSKEKNDLFVSNCHKIPSSEFNRVKSNPSELVNEYVKLINKILQANNKAKIILSVSPVKHLRDGLINNNRSKAVLLLAAEELSSKFDSVYYYPAFELVQDDLRDYRFYAQDMAHPSDEAVEYIWEHFMNGLFAKRTKEIYKKIKSLQHAIDHRPLHPDHLAYPKFLKNTLSKMRKVEKEFDFIDFKTEKRDLEERLIAN